MFIIGDLLMLIFCKDLNVLKVNVIIYIFLLWYKLDLEEIVFMYIIWYIYLLDNRFKLILKWKSTSDLLIVRNSCIEKVVLGVYIEE